MPILSLTLAILPTLHAQDLDAAMVESMGNKQFVRAMASDISLHCTCRMDGC